MHSLTDKNWKADVGTHENVLIVEDEEEWRGVYERAVGALGGSKTVSVATDLTSAEKLIEAAKFAVAFVDIGLDVADDHNVDGLRVMEKIRAVGDETSIVVVTGRSGQDVLLIARNAFKDYKAFDTVGKGTATPKDIRKLLEGALDAYRKAVTPGRMDARDALSGDVAPNVWDDRAMRAIGFGGTVGEFYSFLSQLLGDYLPLVPARGRERTIVDQGRRLVYGGYWSRGIAAAIAVCVGASDRFDAAVKAALETFGADITMHSIRELEGPGVKGGVFMMRGQGRDTFADR
jgi:CheY-like chemotaxis protein